MKHLTSLTSTPSTNQNLTLSPSIFQHSRNTHSAFLTQQKKSSLLFLDVLCMIRCQLSYSQKHTVDCESKRKLGMCADERVVRRVMPMTVLPSNNALQVQTMHSKSLSVMMKHCHIPILLLSQNNPWQLAHLLEHKSHDDNKTQPCKLLVDGFSAMLS